MEDLLMTPVKRIHQNWMPGIFNDFLGNEWLDTFPHHVNSLPATNITETEDEYKIELAVPGIEKEDFQISINNDNELVVSAEKKTEKEEKDKKEKFLRREFGYTQFKQTMLLPDNVDRNKIEAKNKHGILTIEIKKKTKDTKLETKPIIVK